MCMKGIETYWSSRVWRLCKSATGLSSSNTKQLYNTVAVPGFTYGAEVWYSFLHKPEHASKTKGSVAITNKLRSVQRKVAKVITGGLSTTAGDILDVHAYILPIDLLFCKLLFRVALWLCSLPSTHPLHSLVRMAASCKIKRHLSPLHRLMYFSHLSPKDIESISPVRRSPGYTPSFNITINPTKENALPSAILTNATVPIRVYSDGSGFEGGIGASALLFINNHLSKTLHYYLGTEREHTVYEAEGVGLAMGLHLLKGLSRQFTHSAALGTDSQALIKAFDNQQSHAGQYILDNVHQAVEQLHAKQDGLFNRVERAAVIRSGGVWTGRTKGVFDLQLHWVPGHCDFEPNEMADEEAKKAAQGSSSDAKLLPSFLRKHIPLSVSALRQGNINKLKSGGKGGGRLRLERTFCVPSITLRHLRNSPS
jgi:ribonuclease HI